MPQIVTGPPRRGRKIGFHGNAKDGKTTAATAIASMLGPNSPWGEKIAYFAWDDNSELLLNVPPELHDKFVVSIPTSRTLGDGREVYSPFDEAADMLRRDWSKEYPGCGTIIWDTVSTTASQILPALALSGVFSTKQIRFGSVAKGTETILPMEGDYRAAQAAMMRLFDIAKARQAHMNIIYLFHTRIVEPNAEQGESFTPYGGPATVGKGQVNTISGIFDDLFFIESKVKTNGQTGKRELKFTVHTSKHEVYSAGSRRPLGIDFDNIDITNAPLNLWERYMAATNMKENN